MAADLSQVQQMQQKYIEYFELSVESHVVLLEAMQGKKFGYSMQRLAKVLATEPKFQDYAIYVVCTPENLEERKDLFQWLGIPRVQPVLHATEEYNRLLATAGVLINENSFQHHFIKKENQIYVRVWNGIPMKAGGRYSDTDYAGIGNTQRNLLCADYLVCPNEFTIRSLSDNYMLSNLGRTRVLYAGRFQNEILFDEAVAEEVRGKYGLEGRQTYLYVPTIRGLAGSIERQKNEAALWETLRLLDTKLEKDQVVYVSAPYRLREEYDYASLSHIAFAPRSLSLLKLMTVAESFITDCSDMIFDVAAARKNIVLFSFDQTEQMMEQYYSLHANLPFAKAATIEELVKEINTGKNYDDTSFFETYCKYNKPGMAEAVLCRTILGESRPELQETTLPDNGKKNIVIYPGPLFTNGITASILSLLEHLDREKNNYTLFFRTEHVQQVAETLKQLPEGISYYGYTHVSGITAAEEEFYEPWQNDPEYPYESAKPIIFKRMERERQRLLSFLRIDTVIHYEGYGRDILVLFELMPCHRIIYLHNNMLLEIEKKGIRPEPLCRAYNQFDVVALVSEEQRKVAEQMVAMGGGDPRKTNIVLAKNVIPYEQVLRRSKEEVTLDAKTELNMPEACFRKLLVSKKKKFITIGRFLPEKGHARLITAFEKVHKEHPDTCLILLGGYGPLYEETVQQAAESTAAEDIAIIKYMSNPYALLAACDYFVLSSYYEGLPVVLTEADIVGLPCVSTDIPGPRKMMGRYGGLLVEDSEAGVHEGMLQCLTGQAPERFNLNYLEYNKEAVAQFEAMLPER